jgi:hypothetical protein
VGVNFNHIGDEKSAKLFLEGAINETKLRKVEKISRGRKLSNVGNGATLSKERLLFLRFDMILL